jgi:uncharacterized membrane protein YhaH (DUF805 family)
VDQILEPFRRSFDYSGRSRRREYWGYALVTFIVLNVIGWIEETLGLDRADGGPGSPVGGIVWLVLMIPGLAVAIRRLHDSNRAGWWVLLPVAPFLFWIIALVGGFSSDSLFPFVMVAIVVAPLVFLVLMCLPGTRGPNRFGPDPKGDSLADIFA